MLAAGDSRVRISATDWTQGGWDLEQSIVFARELEKRGAAYIHVSSGGLSPAQKIPLGPNYQVPLAEGVPLMIAVVTLIDIHAGAPTSE